MSDSSDQQVSTSLAEEMAKRRGKSYPAHTYIAEKFPDYVKVLIELDEVIRARPRRFDEKRSMR